MRFIFLAAVALVLLLEGAESARPSTLFRTWKLREKAEEMKQLKKPIKSKIPPVGTAYSDYILPLNIMPQHQLVRLQPFLNGNRTIKGYTEATFECRVATSSIALNVEDITIDSDSVQVTDLTDSQPYSVLTTTNDLEHFFWIAGLDAPLVVGNNYSISLEFVSNLQTDYDGAYVGSYENGTINYVATQFEPHGVRKTFPSWDYPTFKFTFTTELVREDNLSSDSNMPLVSSQPEPNQPGWTRDTFERSPIMPAYLNAYLVSDFLFNSISSNGITYGLNAQRDLIQYSDYGLAATRDTLEYFQAYFNYTNPLPKVDSNALPEFFSGAMENWGLINYIDWCLLYDSSISPAYRKQTVCEIVGHEVQHFWTGNLITVYDWNHIWVQEGVTEFYSYKGCHYYEPTMKTIDMFASGSLQSAFRRDDDLDSHPLIFDIAHPYEANNVFDTITYSKGSSIARMIEYIVTESTMQVAMQNYVSDNAYGNTNTSIFLRAIDDQATLDGTTPSIGDMTQIMVAWTQMRGYPLLTVNRTAAGIAQISQKRFGPVNNPINPSYSWSIPITYATESNPDFNFTISSWLEEGVESDTITGLPLSREGVIFNVQYGGFYRVNYDDNSWNDIIDWADTDHTTIHVQSRIQLIEDSWALAIAGHIEDLVAFRLTNFLRNEKEYSVLDPGFSHLVYVDAMCRSTADAATLHNYLLSIVVPILDDVEYDEDNANEDYPVLSKRELAMSWAGYLGHQPSLDYMTTKFVEFSIDPSNESIVQPNSRDPVYCNGVREGGMTEFDVLYNKFQTEVVELEIYNLLYGMSCSEDVLVVERYLNLAFDSTSGIRKDDIESIFNYMLDTPIAEVTAWNYIENNAPACAAYTSWGDVEYYTYIITQNFNNAARLQEVQDFQATYSTFFETTYVQMAIDRVTENIDWTANKLPPIVDWLNTNRYAPVA